MQPRAIVLFDGRCGLCAGSARRLRALDWMGRLRLLDAHDPAAAAACPAVDPGAALRRIQVVTSPTAPPLEGFHAIRWLAGRLPALWIVWPLLHLPGVRGLGVRAYDLVARHRHRFSR